MNKPSNPAPSTPRTGKKRRWIWITALLLAGVVTLVLVARHRGAEPQQAGEGRQRRGPGGGAIPVVTVPAASGSIDVSLKALGTAVPRNTVTVRARVDGQLLRVAFREGQIVKAGELLAEIDPRPFQVALAQAVGQLARDEALLRNAELDLARYKTLQAQDSIARQQVDTQEALVQQYRGTVAVDRGQVDSAKLQLSYTRITAPLAGRVGLRQVDPGNMVHASDAGGIVTLTQTRPITVVFTLPEDSLPAVLEHSRGGQALPVEAFDREQKKQLATGKLLTVDNQIDPTSGTVKLKAEFPNLDDALFPNQFVNVRMKLETREGAVIVPSAAIQRGKQNSTFVYVVKDGQTVTVRPVVPGPVEGERTAIDSGLAAGEVVVSDGTDKLREGARIQIPGKDAGAAGAGGGGQRKWQGGQRPEGGRQGRPAAQQ